MSTDPKTENDDPVTEFIHELKVPFDYAYLGETTKANFITLKAPSGKTPYRAELKQCFFRALNNDTNATVNTVSVDSDDKKQEIPSGSEIVQLICMSRHVELSVFLEYGKKLLTSGVALIDGETKLTKLLIESMDPDELEEMLGDYMANFILASALRKLLDS